MIVRRYVATFLPIMHIVLWHHSWKSEGKKIQRWDFSACWYPNSM